MLGVGEYDERVFLDENAAIEIGTPAKAISDAPGETTFNEKIRTSRNLGQEFDGAAFMPGLTTILDAESIFAFCCKNN